MILLGELDELNVLISCKASNDISVNLMSVSDSPVELIINNRLDSMVVKISQIC